MTVNAKAKYVVLALLCTAVSGLLLQCASDPVGPQLVAKNYYFYADDVVGTAILKFAPRTGVLDTVEDVLPPHNPSDVSADGRFLYINFGTSMSVYTTDSFRLVRSLAYPSYSVASSPDGNYIALFGYQQHGMRILRLPDYSLIYSDDSSDASEGTFSSDSRTLYYIERRRSMSGVVRLHLDSSFRSSRMRIPSMPGQINLMAPSVDEKLWFLYSVWYWDGGSFGVYDVARDSLIYLTSFSPGWGWLVVSPDGKNVFFTNPGSLYPGTPPPSAFYIYDIPSNAVKEVSTVNWGNGHPSFPRVGMSIGSIAITPDGKTLVAARGLVGADVLVFDVPSQTITNYYYFDETAWPYNIKCQTGR